MAILWDIGHLQVFLGSLSKLTFFFFGGGGVSKFSVFFGGIVRIGVRTFVELIVVLI